MFFEAENCCRIILLPLILGGYWLELKRTSRTWNRGKKNTVGGGSVSIFTHEYSGTHTQVPDILLCIWMRGFFFFFLFPCCFFYWHTYIWLQHADLLVLRRDRFLQNGNVLLIIGLLLLLRVELRLQRGNLRLLPRQLLPHILQLWVKKMRKESKKR